MASGDSWHPLVAAVTNRINKQTNQKQMISAANIIHRLTCSQSIGLSISGWKTNHSIQLNSELS